MALFAGTTSARADDLEDAQARFRRGDYAEALKLAQTARKQPLRQEAWSRLEAETLMMLGRYQEAYKQLVEVLAQERNSYTRRPSLRLRLLAREAAFYAQRPAQEMQERLREIGALLNNGPRYAPDADYFASLGEAALLLGAEPRLVLENFFKRAQQEKPPSRDGFLASGRLALDKHDYRLASRAFQDGLKVFPDDVDLWCGLAASFQNGDRTKLGEYAQHALGLNAHHIPTRLLLAEHAIDAEDYEGATRELGEIRTINSRHPEALALLSVVAHLRNDEVAAADYRGQALSTWRENPHVDHLIGRKLSQKYRFNEGAAAQRLALGFDEKFTPAKLQLAQDLLRLARDDEGWPLIKEAHDADAYDVTAFNLVSLRDRLSQFATLSSPHFRLRMSHAEARIYGDRALALLEEARQKLTTKYGLQLDAVTVVEIYPDPKDFAVRTFGMPDNPGYLGVCFGPVVTANSPSTQRANWESVLWHEFCHVVTLTMTRNRMPRWLSEGISVYEELQRNRSWGQRMSVDYRERILGGKMAPIGRMSSAFLQAKDSKDLQFAYFQSYLVVEFLAEKHGLEKMKALLRALYAGTSINDALAQQIQPIADLESDFAAYARDVAKKLGGRFDITRPGEGIAGTLSQMNPLNYHVRLQAARRLVDEKKWEEARSKLQELTESGLYLPGEDNAQTLLARVCAELKDTDGERAAWQTVAERESDALPAVTRLLAIAEKAANWTEVTRWAEAWIAINPVSPAPWRALLDAHEQLKNAAPAIVAGRTLLELAPTDPAAIHLRVAKQLEAGDTTAARRHVLLALAEAPRYLAAYDLLRKLPSEAVDASANASPAPESPKAARP